MRKKLAAAGIALAGLALLGTGGTYAALSDTEESAVLVEAGRLDLSVTTNEDTELAPLTFTDLIPGPAPVPGTYTPSDRFYYLRLTNDGTVPGRALWRSQRVAERDNGCNEPEIAAGDTTCQPNQAGELGDQLLLSFSLMPDDQCAGTPSTVPPETYSPTSSLQYAEIKPGGAGTGLVLGAGESRCVRIDVYFPSTSKNNITQSDTSSFRLSFRLNQA